MEGFILSFENKLFLAIVLKKSVWPSVWQWFFIHAPRQLRESQVYLKFCVEVDTNFQQLQLCFRVAQSTGLQANINRHRKYLMAADKSEVIASQIEMQFHWLYPRFRCRSVQHTRHRMTVKAIKQRKY